MERMEEQAQNTGPPGASESPREGKWGGARRILLVVFLAGWAAATLYMPAFPYRWASGRIFSREILDFQEVKFRYDGDFRHFASLGNALFYGRSDIYHEDLLKEYQQHPDITTYPPTFYFLMIPFGMLPLAAGTSLWLILKLLSIPFTAFFLADAALKTGSGARERLLLTAFLAIAIFASAPAMEEMLSGQVNLFLLFLLCLSMHLLRKDRLELAGLALGLVFCLKLISLPAILYFALRKKWRIVLPAVVFIGVVCAVILGVYGPGIFRDYFATFPVRASHWLNWQNQSTAAFLRVGGAALVPGKHDFFQRLNPAYYAIALGILCGGLAFLCRQKTEDRLYQFSLLTVTAILISPIVWAAHHVWLAIPLACLIAALCRKERWSGPDTVKAAALTAIYFFFAFFDGTNVTLESPLWLFNRTLTLWKAPFILTLVIWGLLFLTPPDAQGGTARPSAFATAPRVSALPEAFSAGSRAGHKTCDMTRPEAPAAPRG
jgi:hypothetical protein